MVKVDKYFKINLITSPSKLMIFLKSPLEQLNQPKSDGKIKEKYFKDNSKSKDSLWHHLLIFLSKQVFKKIKNFKSYFNIVNNS